MEEMKFFGLVVGSWADWFGAIGTIGAVAFAVKNRTDKANIVLSASYTENLSYIYDIKKFEKTNEKITDVVYSENAGDNLGSWNRSLKIFFNNKGQSSGVIDSWGIIDENGKENKLSIEPIFIKGFDILEINRYTEMELNMDYDYDYDYIIDMVEKSIKRCGYCKLYFKDINDRKSFFTLKKKTISNKTI